MTSDTLPRKSAPITSELKLRLDVWIALATAGLIACGLLVVYSSSFDLAFRARQDPLFYLRTQVMALGLGVVAIVVILQVDYHFFRRLSVPALLVTVLLLIAVLLFGDEAFGARRTLFGASVQPAEMAKLTTILYISHWLSSKGDRLKSVTYGLAPFALMVGLVCFFVAQQPSLSASALIAAISFTLFFLAGADLRHFAVALTLASAVFALLLLTWPHAQFRLDAWRDALIDPNSAPYQIRLAVILLGAGGLTGQGMGEGVNKYLLPAAHTDGVFAVWGEEMGFLGSLLLIGLFGLLVWRGMVAARAARDRYGYLLAMGVTMWFAYQALMNIAVITSTIPFTGMPMPFLSYGGTSLAISLSGVGILLNVSRDAAIGKTLKESRSAFGGTRETVDLRRRDGRPYLSRPGRRR